MKILEKFTYNREYKTLKKKEQKYLKKQSMSSDHFINRKLKGKVEPKLEQTLNSTFQKAFTLVFDKGVGIIQKTFNADKIKEKHNSIDSRITRKNIRKQKNISKSSNIKNLAFTSISSTALGILGIGIPDIFLFTALIIKKSSGNISFLWN